MLALLITAAVSALVVSAVGFVGLIGWCVVIALSQPIELGIGEDFDGRQF